MLSSIPYRAGSDESLAAEFVELSHNRGLKFDFADLEHPYSLIPEKILAVHYADGGAQGDAGAVRILYDSPQGVQILYGNYCYGKLNLDAVIRILPMLKSLDSRYSLTPPYPFGGELSVPEQWRYMYMGAMNHFYIRDVICDQSKGFIEALLQNGGRPWQVFNAVAWFFKAK